MNLKENIVGYKNKLDKELEKFLREKQKETKNLNPFCQEVVDNIKEYALRGSAKRIRGALVNIGYKAFSGTDNKEVMRVACGMELVHAYFLIHDDIIDRDDIRRGGDTMHAVYAKMAKREKFKTENGHFGNSIAIVAGDICASFGYDAILKSSFDAEIKTRALERFNDMINLTCHGQLLDILSAEKKQIDEKEITEIYLNKTARYTIEAPLQIGAILAGADKKQIKLLENYSRPVGIVFQLENDLSEIFTKDEKFDEKTACDISEGKQPLFIITALKNGDAQQKKFIKSLLGKNNIKREELEKLKQIIIDTGALAHCRAFAENQIDSAKKSLAKISFKDKHSHQLCAELGDYLLAKMG